MGEAFGMGWTASRAHNGGARCHGADNGDVRWHGARNAGGMCNEADKVLGTRFARG